MIKATTLSIGSISIMKTENRIRKISEYGFLILLYGFDNIFLCL